MSNAKTIPCPVRCQINPYGKTIGISIESPRTGRELYFFLDFVDAMPVELRDRCRAGYEKGGSASFTLEELRMMVELERWFNKIPTAPPISRTKRWHNRYH